MAGAREQDGLDFDGRRPLPSGRRGRGGGGEGGGGGGLSVVGGGGGGGGGRRGGGERGEGGEGGEGGWEASTRHEAINTHVGIWSERPQRVLKSASGRHLSFATAGGRLAIGAAG